MKSRRPTLMIYCKHANYIVFIINRNYSFNRLLLFPFMTLIYIKIAYKIRCSYSEDWEICAALGKPQCAYLVFQLLKRKDMFIAHISLKSEHEHLKLTELLCGWMVSSCYRKQEDNISSSVFLSFRNSYTFGGRWKGTLLLCCYCLWNCEICQN